MMQWLLQQLQEIDISGILHIQQETDPKVFVTKLNKTTGSILKRMLIR